MALFSRRPQQSTNQRSSLQYPDELAQRAQLQYGSQQFGAAFETFATAVDKLHTMEVVANPQNRIRRPSVDDQYILDGVVNSLGASLTMGTAPADYRELAARTSAYLSQIAAEAEHGGQPAQLYRDAIERINQTVRLHG